MRRGPGAATLQTQHHFRYPLSELVANRVPARSNDDGDLFTDDFAPVNLYETTPAREHKRNNNAYGCWAKIKKSVQVRTQELTTMSSASTGARLLSGSR